MSKVKRFTKKQLTRERLKREREEAAAAKRQRAIEKEQDREGRIIDAVLERWEA